MKLCILSDIHDELAQLNKALDVAESCDAMLCCGDLCSPFVVHHLGKGFKKPMHVVFGNNDGDLFRMTQNASLYDQIKLHGEMADLCIDGWHIGMNHFDTIAPALASSGIYDLVCYGHNHRHEIKQVNQCLLINPGEVYGRLSGASTLVVLDTKTRSPQRVDLSTPRS